MRGVNAAAEWAQIPTDQKYQIRTAFRQQVTFASAGASTQNFTLATGLSDYTKAWVFCVNETDTNIYRAWLPNSSQVTVGGGTGSGDKTITIFVIEYTNLMV